MSYQDRRQKNADVFADTQRWYTGDEALGDAIRHSQRGTVLHGPEPIRVPDQALCRYEEKARVLVSADRTLQAAGKYPGRKVLVLNFASATTPGGGVLWGSSAQEESLCRCSTLYPGLNTDPLWENYYLFHRRRQSTLYTDACIYTPEVLSIKTDTADPRRLPREAWQKVDVLTCAAPNLRETELDGAVLYELHVQRGRQILAAAAVHGAEVVILGAFGCGAFRNPPRVVASAYRQILPAFSRAFAAVEFAVYCPPHDDTNYRVFREILE